MDPTAARTPLLASEHQFRASSNLTLASAGNSSFRLDQASLNETATVDSASYHTSRIQEDDSSARLRAEPRAIWPAHQIPVEDPPLFIPLTAKPMVLRVPFLVFALTCYCACLTGLSLLLYYSWHDGIVRSSYKYARFTIAYLPSLVGTLSMMLYRTVYLNYSRLLPYLQMADPLGLHRPQDTILLRTFPFLFWDVWGKDRVYWVCKALFLILGLSLVPLKTALLPEGSVSYVSGAWQVSVSRHVAFALIIYYFVTSCVVISLIYRLWNAQTGLKWDPVAIADQLLLLRGSNAMEDFRHFETSSFRQMFQHKSYHRYRLGYWYNTATCSVWHGIGIVSTELAGTWDSMLARSVPSSAPFAPLLVSKAAYSNPSEKDNPSKRNDYPDGDDVQENLRDQSLGQQQFYRYSSVILFSQTPTYIICLWLVNGGALGALIYLLVSNKLALGISEHTHGSTSGLDTESIFVVLLLRVLPTLISAALPTWWNGVALFNCVVQPYAGMFEPRPADANVLIDYLCCLPVQLSIKAFAQSDWKVCWTSLVALVSPVVPVLISGLFTYKSIPNGYEVFISPTSFYGVLSFLVAYVFLIPLATPRSNRYLPRQVDSMATLITFVHQSRIMDDPTFALDHQTDTRRDMECKLYLAKQKYLFGLYLGKDGKRHLGFDVAERVFNEDGQVHVEEVQAIPAPKLHWMKLWHKRPKRSVPTIAYASNDALLQHRSHSPGDFSMTGALSAEPESIDLADLTGRRYDVAQTSGLRPSSQHDSDGSMLRRTASLASD